MIEATQKIIKKNKKYMDEMYWKNYYQEIIKSGELSEPSTFAKFCIDFINLKNIKTMLDMGCGNGRDTKFFNSLGFDVYGVDLAVHEDMQILGSQGPKYYSGDFVNFDYASLGPIDFFYSRFTLHAISLEEELIVIQRVYDLLPIGGVFAIEARTVNDPLFGQGVNCGLNIFMTDHKRRFIVADHLVEKLKNTGFEILYFTESNNLSIYKGDNPVLVRIIVKK